MQTCRLHARAIVALGLTASEAASVACRAAGRTNVLSRADDWRTQRSSSPDPVTFHAVVCEARRREIREDMQQRTATERAAVGGWWGDGGGAEQEVGVARHANNRRRAASKESTVDARFGAARGCDMIDFPSPGNSGVAVEIETNRTRHVSSCRQDDSGRWQDNRYHEQQQQQQHRHRQERHHRHDKALVWCSVSLSGRSLHSRAALDGGA